MPNECINYFNWPICLQAHARIRWHDSESKMAVGNTLQLSVLYDVRHSLSFTVIAEEGHIVFQFRRIYQLKQQMGKTS